MQYSSYQSWGKSQENTEKLKITLNKSDKTHICDLDAYEGFFLIF